MDNNDNILDILIYLSLYVESYDYTIRFYLCKITWNNPTFSWYSYNNLTYWSTMNNLNFEGYFPKVNPVTGWLAIAIFIFFKKRIN